MDIPAVTPHETTLRACEIACSNAHSGALREFLKTSRPYCIVLEDDAIVLEREWMHFVDFDYFQPFFSNRVTTAGREQRLLVGKLPRYGSQAYVASRRFAEAYIPLLEEGVVADHANKTAARGMKIGSYNANAVLHDTAARSMISEQRRQCYLKAQGALKPD